MADSEFFQDEEYAQKDFDAKIFRRLLRYLAPFKWQVAGAVFLLLLVAGLELLGPLLTKRAIDINIAHKDIPGLLHTVILYLMLITFILAGEFLHLYLTRWVGQKAVLNLRMEVFTHLQKLSLSYFDRNPVGRLMTRLTSDVEALDEAISSGLVSIFGDLFTIFGIVVAMLYLNWKLALVCFTVIPLILYASLLLRRYSREPFRQIRLRVAKINAFLNENIAGMIVTQLFNLQKQNFQKFDALNQSYLEANIRTIFYFAVFFPVIELLSSISIALILGYGGWLILGGMLTLGALFAFLQYTERFFYPLRDLSEKYNILLSAFASAERIFTLLDTEVEIQSPLSPVKNLNGKGRIEFNNVTFGYDKGQPVLHNISFTVEPGETLAIVGHTGAGKTTLFNLLCRFYDVHQGAIMVDNLDIRDLNLKDLRRRIGLVQQDLFLFSGTIEYNISLEHQRSDPMAVKEFARTARAHDFIQKKLPQGYNTVLGERGATLSIGQRQLLSFARALAVNPEILLLDEATSSIDPETEKLIQDGLKVLLKGRTSIVIAHRLSTIREADRIIVLHKGRIRETGTHDELLKLKGIYHKLYQIQTGNMIENTCLETIS